MRRFPMTMFAARFFILLLSLLAASCRPPAAATQPIIPSPTAANGEASSGSAAPRAATQPRASPPAPTAATPASSAGSDLLNSSPGAEVILPKALTAAPPLAGVSPTATETPAPPPSPPVATPGPATATPTALPIASPLPTPNPTVAAVAPPPQPARTPRMATLRPPLQVPSVTPFPGTMLIADASNHRLLEVTPDGQIVWQYPAPGSLAPPGWFHYPDDAFFSPDGRSIAVSEETNQVVVVIDYQTQQIVWRYGVPGQAGRDLQHFNYPDDAWILPDGRVAVADIRNCRILLISWDQQNVQVLGRTGDCSGRPGSFASPNGVEPLPDGHLLITEIDTHRVSEIDLQGNVIRAVRLPLAYPSDAFLTARDTLIVADYHTPGRVIEADWNGNVLWSFPTSGSAERLDRPSIAMELPNGNVAICDDHRHRVLVVDRSGQVLWQYGVTGVPGSAPGYLIYPDGIDLHLPATK